MSNPPFWPRVLDPAEQPATCLLIDTKDHKPPPLSFVGYRIRGRRQYLLIVRPRSSAASWSRPPALVDTPAFLDVLGDLRPEGAGVRWTLKSESPGIGLTYLLRLEAHGAIRVRLVPKDGREAVLRVPVLMTGYALQLVLFLLTGIAVTALDLLPVPDGWRLWLIGVVVGLLGFLYVALKSLWLVTVAYRTNRQLPGLRIMRERRRRPKERARADA